ncbi:MAG: hypothetical protein R2774_11660 [Saprospiraceae bacterium]
MYKNLLIIILTLFTIIILKAQNYTVQEVAQMYIEGIVHNNKSSLKKLNDYIKPAFSQKEYEEGHYFIERPTLEEFANNEARNFVNALEKDNDEELKNAMYYYFLEEGKGVQGSKCTITNITISSNKRKAKSAKVEYTCEMPNINFDVEPNITSQSSGKEIAAYYDVLTKRFQVANKLKIANLDFELKGKVNKETNQIVWYALFPTFINQEINMKLTDSEIN